jgi:hypothetical protein
MKRNLPIACMWACLLALAAASWAEEPAERSILAVLDFTVKGISAGEAGLFGDMLTSHIVRSGHYRVIDRRERDAILQEIEFSVSDCSDESCQLQVGRLPCSSASAQRPPASGP